VTTSKPGSEKPYKISVPRKVVKALDLIPDDDFGKIRKAVLALSSQPRPHGVNKLDDAIYRIRLGRYPVIYSVDDRAREIIVLKVAKRGA
jgi:mRNA interferase RelE/StbE